MLGYMSTGRGAATSTSSAAPLRRVGDLTRPAGQPGGQTVANRSPGRTGRGAANRRLLGYTSGARSYLIVTIAFGLAGTGLILAQAGLLARALAVAAHGDIAAGLAGTLAALLVVVAARAAVSYGGEVTALRAAATVKSRLRTALTVRSLQLGPLWLGRQRAGEITTLSIRGLDGLDSYFARYLPQFVLAVVVPIAVLARVAVADWISAVVIAVTLPLIPVFAVLVGWHTKAQTRRQWRLLATLGGHFLERGRGLAHAQGVRPCQSAGRRDRQGHQ